MRDGRPPLVRTPAPAWFVLPPVVAALLVGPALLGPGLAGTGGLRAGVAAASQPPGPTPMRMQQARAVGLLRAAALAARTCTWSATEEVDGVRGRTVLEVSHSPSTGTQLRPSSQGPAAERPDAAGADREARVLELLADRYELQVAGPVAASGRTAWLVEVRRPTAPWTVAGRIWVDTATGLVVQREVDDDAGRPVRRHVLRELMVGPARNPAYTPVAVVSQVEPAAPVGRSVDNGELDALRADGWAAPAELPGRLALYEARWHDGVLHLAYSDGLTTLSVFEQPGYPRGSLRDFTPRHEVGTTVWSETGGAGRMVWTGAGRTWTLLSDAPAGQLQDVVGALPHAPGRRHRPGLARRLVQGLSRLGSWLDPFR